MSHDTVLCRVCLASNVRMLPLIGTPLQLVYQRVTSTIINIADLKPVTACYICYAHLKKCHRLIFTSTKAENTLTSILETNPVVTRQSIALVNCYTNNLCSSLKARPVEYFDISTYLDPIMVKDEPIVDNALVKVDPEYINVKDIVERESENSRMSENAEVCRICLAVGVHMFNLASTPLQIIYERITGNLLHTADSRPIAACYLCRADLRKFHRLMLKASTADKWMTAMLKEHSELSPKLVATLVPKATSLRSSLKTRPAECYDSSTLHDLTVMRHGFEVTVKIEVEPDVYVGSPPPEFMSESENSKSQSETEADINKSRKQHKKRTRKQRVTAPDIEAEIPEGPVSTDPPKPVRRKRKKAENSNIKSKTQVKKEKPRRVYKKRIRAYIHECPVCKRLFNRTNHLKDHMKTHTDDRPFECSICQRRFIQKINLKNHLMTHTGEKPFECEICHTGFIAKSDFKRHLNTHKEERLFECSICQRRFTQMPYLKAHISTHTSEKPHECNICHRRFSQKPYLKNHLKRHVDSERAELKR